MLLIYNEQYQTKEPLSYLKRKDKAEPYAFYLRSVMTKLIMQLVYSILQKQVWLYYLMQLKHKQKTESKYVSKLWKQR